MLGTWCLYGISQIEFTMKKTITVIGSSNVDMIMKMEKLPRLGETVTDAEFFQVYGGKGANTAVGAARAGGNVNFVNCVGDDIFSDPMVENFRKDGINTEFVFKEDRHLFRNSS